MEKESSWQNLSNYLPILLLTTNLTVIKDVSLSSTDSDFVLLGGSSFKNSVSAMTYGDFDLGVSFSK